MHYDIAVKKEIEEREVSGKEKSIVIEKILSYGVLTDDEIEQYVNDYIYGDRVTFTLWTFQTALVCSDFETVLSLENLEEEYLYISGYRKLKILSTKEHEDRTEVLYVYSKEYSYINGDGQSAVEEMQSEVEVPFATIECFKHDSVALTQRLKVYAVNMNEKCGSTCSYPKIQKCVEDSEMACLPKVFYTILPDFRLQPHKGMEYGDVAAEVKIGAKAYELKGIIKKNSKKVVDDEEKIRNPLLSTSKEGQEIIRQFVEQGMLDSRCQIIAVIVPQYIDNGFKGTLRHLARLSGKKVTFIELDELCELISVNEKIKVS